MLTTHTNYRGRATNRGGWMARREVVSILDGATVVDELERVTVRKASETDSDWRVVCERSTWKDKLTRLPKLTAVLACCEEQYSD